MRKLKYILLMSIFIVSLFWLNIESFAKEYESYIVGDKINYNNMDFYVIEDSDSKQDYITLLKAEPLKSDEMKELINSTEIANKVSLSGKYLQTAYVYNDMCGSIEGGLATEGCTTNYSLSSVIQIVDVWSKAKLNDSDLVKDKLGYKTRLIMYDEVINNIEFEKIESFSELYHPDIIKRPSNIKWIYHFGTSYWTMSSKNNSNTKIWEMTGLHLNFSDIHTGKTSGVRPVINLSKDANVVTKDNLISKIKKNNR